MGMDRRSAMSSITHHIVQLDAVLEAKLLKLLISWEYTMCVRLCRVYVQYELVYMALLNCMCDPERGTAYRGQR
jgi:hypothetical protein